MTILQADQRTGTRPRRNIPVRTTGSNQDHTKWPHRITTALSILAGTTATLGLVSVLVAGFVLSLDAMAAVARAAHVRPELSWMLPAAVDGAMAVDTVLDVTAQLTDVIKPEALDNGRQRLRERPSRPCGSIT